MRAGHTVVIGSDHLSASLQLHFIKKIFFLKMGFHHDGQAGLELLISGDPLTSTSQSARITGVSHKKLTYSVLQDEKVLQFCCTTV